MLEIQTGASLPGLPQVTLANPLPSYVEVPTAYDRSGFTYAGAPGGSMLSQVFRTPTHDPCGTPQNAYDVWWCNEGKHQGVPYGGTTWGPSLAGMERCLGSAPASTRGVGLGFDWGAPAIKRSALGLLVVTGLAFLLTNLVEKYAMTPNGSRARRKRRSRARARTRRQTMRRNTSYRGSGSDWSPPSPPYVIVKVVPENGYYFGRVIARGNGKVVWETMRESSPFVAKKLADKKAAYFETLTAAAVAHEIALRSKPHRFTQSGTMLRLLEVPKPVKKPRKSRAKPAR